MLKFDVFIFLGRKQEENKGHMIKIPNSLLSYWHYARRYASFKPRKQMCCAMRLTLIKI
tara:strand:+ start:220249 stop:220425 length:177 start_codon:yes stop_codon:yes gene_type:complete